MTNEESARETIAYTIRSANPDWADDVWFEDANRNLAGQWKEIL
jgi:hypothetical protein